MAIVKQLALCRRGTINFQTIKSKQPGHQSQRQTLTYARCCQIEKQQQQHGNVGEKKKTLPIIT